jgi:hypothetical protein
MASKQAASRRVRTTGHRKISKKVETLPIIPRPVLNASKALFDVIHEEGEEGELSDGENEVEIVDNNFTPVCTATADDKENEDEDEKDEEDELEEDDADERSRTPFILALFFSYC